MYTILDLKSLVTSKIHGASLKKVNDFDEKCFQAAQAMQARADFRETIRKVPLTNAIYNKVYDYVLAGDVKKIIDIAPQVNRSFQNDDVMLTYDKSFDLRKGGDNGSLAVQWNNSVQSLRFSKRLDLASSVLHTMQGITDNGTWAVGGDASNLAVDTVDFVSGFASLGFDLSGATGIGYIENSTMTAADWTQFLNLAGVFDWWKFPDASRVTSVELRWGTDSSNYWTVTKTSPQDQSTFKTGWNLVRNDWPAAKTGTPTITNIKYARLTINYSTTAGVFNGIRVDNIIAQLGRIFDIEYYSNYLFRSASGNWLEKPTADTDILNLSTVSYPIFWNELMKVVCQELQGRDSSVDYATFSNALNGQVARNGKVISPGLYDLYTKQYPSQELMGQVVYYDFDNTYPGGNGWDMDSAWENQ